MKNFSRPDGLVREDFPGGWSGDKDNKFVAAGRSDKENDAFNYVKTLANYRKNTTALQSGKMTQYLPEKGIYVYFRYDDKNTVMVVYNSNKNDATGTTERYSQRIGDFKKAKNIVTGETIDINTLILPAKSTLVLELMK
jgi:neopullulanase